MRTCDVCDFFAARAAGLRQVPGGMRRVGSGFMSSDPKWDGGVVDGYTLPPRITPYSADQKNIYTYN